MTNTIGQWGGNVSRCAGQVFYTVVGGWNPQPGVMVKADAIVLFKRVLDRHTNNQVMESYDSNACRGDQFNLTFVAEC